MKKTFAVTFAAMTLGLSGPLSAVAADLAPYRETYQDSDDRNGVKIGYLTCDVGGGVGYVIGSAKELECTFKSTIGARRTDSYTGVIRKMGVDLGFTTQGQAGLGSVRSDGWLSPRFAVRPLPGRNS